MKIGPHSVANDVRMRRQQFRGAILLVEGSIDSLFLKRFINTDSCMLLASNGKDNALGALEILVDAGVPGVLGIVDADFDQLNESLPQLDSLLLYDHHDMEVMLLDSPALDDLLTECGSEEKIRRFEDESRKGVRSAIFNLAQEVGLLRLHSLRQNLSLRFEGLNFGNFVDSRTFAIDVESLVSTVKNHSQRHDLDGQVIAANLEKLRAFAVDPRLVSCGHDAIEVLSLGLRRILGSMNHSESQPAHLERNLRLAYEHEYFRGTLLYASIRRWQEDNPPFVIVR